MKRTKKFIKIPEKVMFGSLRPIAFPVPSPALLALHAACAKVTHFSGVGEYIDQLDKDMEEIGVLAYDGASSDVLSHVFSRSLPRSVPVGA